MNVITRGIRNAFRNGIRSFSIIFILGLSIALALTMTIARQAVEDKIARVKSSIGNTIAVSPAGVQGFEGGGNPLTTKQITAIKSLANVTSVTSILSDRLTATNTNLASSINAGSLGQRNARNNGVDFQSFGGNAARGRNFSQADRTFTPPVRVTGVDNLSLVSVFGGSSVTYTSGGVFDPAKDQNVALVGKNLAEKNNLKVGSTFQAYDKNIKVVGIYDTGTAFANDGVVMPLATVQRLSSQPNDITSATVTVNSVDNLDGTVSAIKSKLGSSADVTSSQETAQTAIQPLENVKTIASYSLVAAVFAGSVIILLTMIMVVRERRREIGVMKAIGSSNMKTMLQFMAESIVLTVISLVIGLVLSIAVASPITDALVKTSTTTSQSSQQRPTRGGFGGGFGAVRTFADNSFTTVETKIGWQTLGYGIVAAFIIALVGSAVPAYLISRVRPSEVMRAE